MTLMTIPEVAEHLRVSERHVRRLTRSGRLVCVRDGRVVRYLESDVEAYIMSGRVCGEPSRAHVLSDDRRSRF
jgi:excisionase family DNA binding protein